MQVINVLKSILYFLIYCCASLKFMHIFILLLSYYYITIFLCVLYYFQPSTLALYILLFEMEGLFTSYLYCGIDSCVRDL